MSRPIVNALLGTATLILAPISALPASAQYRDGQPTTMPRPAVQPDPALAVMSRFRATYARVGSPRIVILWNRSFDDEVASSYRDHTRTMDTESTTTAGLEETTQGPVGVATRREGSDLRKRMTDTVSGSERVAHGARGAMTSEPVDWQVEQAFTSTLAQAGVQMVDRAMAMRLTGAAMGAGERANVQGIETEALAGRADLIVEVLQSPDSRAPDGVVFRMTVRDLKNARQIANVMTAGHPPKPRMGYVAGPNGFVRATAPEPGPSDIGAQLAITLMSSLASSLR